MNKEDAARQEAGRVLFAGSCRFVAAADKPPRIPSFDAPEIAFAGRSNVGKSSLLNALVGRTGLARVSRTPGRTRELIFFDLAGRLMLVDMPGYGYAKAPKVLACEWHELMLSYLQGRSNLRRVILLLDARRSPSNTDCAFMALLNRLAVAFQIVLTKADAVSSDELAVRAGVATRLARDLAAAHPVLITTSSRSGTNIDRLRAELALLTA